MQGHNPNKNLIVAIVLSAAVLMGWQYFIVKPRVDAEQKAVISEKANQTSALAPSDGVSVPSASSVTPPTSSSSLPATDAVDLPIMSLDRASALKADTTGRVVINTPEYKGSVSLAGGRLDDLTLNHHHQTPAKDSPNVALLSPSTSFEASFVELGYTSAVAGVTLPNGKTVWSADTSKTLTADSPVTLTWNNDQGLKIDRTFSLKDGFLLSVQDTITNTSGSDVTVNPYALVKRNLKEPYTHESLVHEGPLGWLGNQLQEYSYKKVKDNATITFDSTGGWTGFSDKYWLTALVPPANEKISARYLFNDSGNGRHGFQVDYQMGSRTVPAGGSVQIEQNVLTAPKVVSMLEKYEDQHKIAGLNYAVDWGFFWFFTKPIFFILDLIYSVVKNFGISILLLTLVIKALFYPLANKSYVMMAKMRTLQPRMEEIKKQYAGDAMGQQKAMLELYQREKVNPLSGCLPMLVQIPVFFALYKVLSIAIEMRHAPFFGWIHDLSAPDPTNIFTLFGLIQMDLPPFLHLGIWPLLLGISMFLQQKLSPASPDPVQRKVMMFMPVMFTFILAPFAAGLIIYWTWNNLLSIVQQTIITNRIMKETQGGKVEVISPSKK